jgi:hypothetical protein
MVKKESGKSGSAREIKVLCEERAAKVFEDELLVRCENWTIGDGHDGLGSQAW